MRKSFIYILLLLTNCTYLSIDEITVDCNEFPISIETVVTNADCGLNNGSVTIQASGGMAPYQYLINNVSQADNVFEMLPAGNYQVTVVDANECSGQSQFVVLSKDGVIANAIASPSGCNTMQGVLTVSAINGVAPYLYSLDNGAFQSSNEFIDLASGDHSVLVTDQNGCSFVLQEAIPTGVSYSKSIDAIIMDNCAVTGCHGGSQFPDFRIFENIQNNKDNIKTRTQNKSMPTGGGSLTQEQIDLIACWVDDGGLDN